MPTNENPALAGGVSEDGHAATLIVSEDTSTTAPAQANRLAFHPLADIFPLLEGYEFEELVADIKANGLIEDIVLYDGMILDGRNRYRACCAAGIEPTYRPFTGDDPAAFVISANIRRRHLTPLVKRAVIAKLLAAHPEKSDRQIAETTKASPTTVGTVRAEMEAKGDVSKLDTRTDTKGRQQPAKKKSAAIVEQHRQARVQEQERKRERERVRREREEWRSDISGFAYKLIRLDIEIARELHRVLVASGGDAMQLMDDIAAGIEIEAAHEPTAASEAVAAVFEEWADDLAARMRQGESTAAPDDPLDDIPPFLQRTAGPR
jgi:ParB-like chromosome segregation protein Spo0J